MTTGLNPFPGGEDCPLEAFRRRIIRAVWTLLALGAFGFALSIAWYREPETPPCEREPAGGVKRQLNCAPLR
jgi:hypothetical protein